MKEWKSPPIPILDRPIGEERLLVLAIPQEEGAPVADLRWLEQDPLAVVRGATLRGAGQGGAFGDVLEELAFGETGDATRGFGLSHRGGASRRGAPRSA